ncbi:MAG: hypothetical protein KAR21_11590, partial [Spirochaetales bacterium]|nr:hypothetical protein [Spirochaetales bacterium]
MRKKRRNINIFSMNYRRSSRATLLKLFLLSVVLMLALVSCPQPFNLIESLDGPEGLSLSISPESAQVVITESITITAEGGAPPYIF